MPITEMDDIIPLYDAMMVHQHEYDSGDTDYSVTTLLDPPRVVHLNKRHLGDCDLYVKDLMASWDGTAAHKYLEYCLEKVDGGKKYSLERRYGFEILNRKISGCYDVLWNKKRSLWDLKKTSTWKHVFGDKTDWIAQQNMYSYLMWFNDKIQVKQINIMAFYKDWSKYQKMRYGSDYPMHPIMRYRLPVWEHDKTYKYFGDRVQLMIDNEGTPDDLLPACSMRDMWHDPDTWAVKAVDRKNALRVLSSEDVANDWISGYLANPKCKHKISQLSIEYRPSIRKRCEDWCHVRDYCNQFHSYLKDVATLRESREE